MELGDSGELQRLGTVLMVLLQSQPVVLPVLVIAWVAGMALAFASGNFGR